MSEVRQSEVVSIYECDRCKTRFLAKPWPGWTHWTPTNWLPRRYCHGNVRERRFEFPSGRSPMVLMAQARS
jgi:hypothetical protein